MEKHKRYLVFLYEAYYPCGGLSDLRASFNTIEESVRFIKESEYYYFKEIYDRIDGVEVDLKQYGID